jgi:hypothetical protein
MSYRCEVCGKEPSYRKRVSDHRQPTVTTSTGSSIPFNVTVRRPSSGTPNPSTVAVLAVMSSPSPNPAMRAAWWTPLPRREGPTTAAWRPMRTRGANPWVRRC